MTDKFEVFILEQLIVVEVRLVNVEFEVFIVGQLIVVNVATPELSIFQGELLVELLYNPNVAVLLKNKYC
jgi:hypothetical protein